MSWGVNLITARYHILTGYCMLPQMLQDTFIDMFIIELHGIINIQFFNCFGLLIGSLDNWAHNGQW